MHSDPTAERYPTNCCSNVHAHFFFHGKKKLDAAGATQLYFDIPVPLHVHTVLRQRVRPILGEVTVKPVCRSSPSSIYHIALSVLNPSLGNAFPPYIIQLATRNYYQWRNSNAVGRDGLSLVIVFRAEGIDNPTNTMNYTLDTHQIFSGSS